jgi:hypothetical protein
MRARVLSLFLVLTCLPLAANAQPAPAPVDVYLASPDAQAAFDALAKTAADPQKRPLTPAQTRNLLPLANINNFVRYVITTRPGMSANEVEALRLNKILQGAAASGGTSALSGAIGPALLGAAVEYGGVLQESTGTTTTLRGNLLGLARLAAGEAQFPYCPALAPQGCSATSRRLRRISGVVSFEQISPAAEKPAAAAPTSSDLLGSNYRVASFGAKIELSAGGHLDDPVFVAAWAKGIAELRRNGAADELGEAFSNLFDGDNLNLYSEWEVATRAALDSAKSADQFRAALDAQLNSLADQMLAADSEFPDRIRALSRALSNYRTVRDEMIRQAQVHKSSLEYTHRSPLNQPGTSNLRYIYSHQPGTSPVIYTVNAALTIYDSATSAPSRWRDLQVAAQLDRRLGRVPSLGNAVFTLALYYQWMRDDAAVTFGDTAAATLPGLALAEGAESVLGTAGHIVVFQGRLAVPLNDVVKVPFSMTYANRRELIPEKQTWRGQVGLSIDLDGLFR